MKLHKIIAGTFHIDGGAAFGVVPKVVWQKRYPADKDNYCTIAMRCILVDTGERLVLIETGTGDKQLDYLKYYKFKGVINFDKELRKLGYNCADVTDVIFTHLHFDHCGGATKYNADRTAVELVFPNATHWVGEAQWQNFLLPNVREGDSYFKENVMPIFEAGKLSLVKENQFICDEVEVRIFNGHTIGQLGVYIYTPERTFIYAGDVIPLAANVPVAWLSSYDTNPLAAMAEKEELLKEAVRENQVIILVHDAYTDCCTISESYGKYRVNETFQLEEIVQR